MPASVRQEDAVPRWRQLLGAGGERAAEKFLRGRRYRILARNYRCPRGEVDLVALDGPVVVFVEVKTRRGSWFGSPYDAVDARKREQIVRAAEHYVLRHRLHDRQIRFDVIAVWWNDGEATCELIQDAFEADET